jgi:predicted Zn-dependent protease
MNRYTKFFRTCSLLAAAVLLGGNPLRAADTGTDLLKAMHDEMARSMHQLQLQLLEKPYYIEYRVNDQYSHDIKATFGSLVESHSTHYKTLSVGIRIGAPVFDNTNFFDIGLNFFGSSDDEERFRGRRIPNELGYENMRRELWLATDAAYKQASELLAKKHAALKNRMRLDTVPDFALLPAERRIDTMAHPRFDTQYFEKLCVDLSAVFRDYPAISVSTVGVEYLPKNVYYTNTEGREFIKTDLFTGLEIVASTQAQDGMPIAQSYSAYSLDPANLPNRDSLLKAAHQIAQKLSAMVTSSTIEAYSGPVMFEGQAAAEMFAQVFSPNLVTQRPMVTDGGVQDNDRYTAFQSKIGGRVLPEFLSIEVKPNEKTFGKTPLIGTYTVDDEGIPAGSFTIVKDGYLKGLMSSRVPTKRVRESNGHQRGGAAIMSVLEVSATPDKQMSGSDMRARLQELCKARELPYGIIVRKALNQNLLYTTLFQLTSGEYPFTRGESTVSLLEVYKLYPDGREELVRGCEAAGLSPQSFKDILAVGKNRFAYNYLAAAVTSPFVTGGSQFIGSSIVAPDLLFEDLEIRPVEADFAKPPLLPHPYFSDNKK